MAETKKYVVSKDNGWTKVRDAIKADITADFLEFLAEKYAANGMVRCKSGDSETNEIAFLAATVEEDGTEYPAYCRFNPTIPAWKERPYGKKKKLLPFDFAGLRTKYDKYVADKAQKEADSAKKKAEKIEKDTAKREKEKAEKEKAK